MPGRGTFVGATHTSPGGKSRGGGGGGTNDQKSICALTFTKRGVSTDCGASHAPPGAKVWL
jgi:hypothetical protein